jgi:threonine synthase
MIERSIGLKLRRFRVGNTRVIQIPELLEMFDLPNLLIKDESMNPFGTFKDRRNKLVMIKALKENIKYLAIITSGNAGYSLARMAQGTNIKVICIVDKHISSYVKEQLKKYSEVIEVDLLQNIFRARAENFQSEELINFVEKKMGVKDVVDVTNGYHEAFHDIIKEIKAYKPDFIVAPVGSGEAFVGLYEGLKKYKMMKTRLIGVGVHSISNGVLELRKEPSIADKLFTPYTPYKDRIERILQEGHLYVHVSDDEILEAFDKVGKMVSCEPSSAAVFAALPKLTLDRKSKVIVINSGRGVWLFNRQAWRVPNP